MFSTQATIFKAGPYPGVFNDFRILVRDLQAAFHQLHSHNYSVPLLHDVPNGRQMLRRPINTSALRVMCLIMHHTKLSSLDRDAWGDDLCRYTKSVTFGLRTGG